MIKEKDGMTGGEYRIKLVQPDEMWDKVRVELHDVDLEGSSDFLGIDPSVSDIAMMEGGRPHMASGVAMAERAIGLADSTREYHDSLVAEAEEWLDNEAVSHPDSMNPDEHEAGIALGIIHRQTTKVYGENE